MTQKNNHKLRIGIVGAGGIVRTRHLPALKKNPDVEIVAVSNSTYESSEKFCRNELPQATPMRNWADLLAVPDLDIIWIGTPPYMHSAVTISALEAGKHVFCQARMAMDLAEAREMLAASKRYPELVTMLCPPPYGMRADLLVKKLLAENYLGRPHHVRLQSDITGVFARGKIVHPIRQGYEVIIPDVLNVLCSFENGAEGVLEFSGVNAFAPGDRCEIYGHRGTLVYDFATDIVQIGKVGDKEMRVADLPPDLATEWHVEDDFIGAVKSKGRVRPHPDFEDGVRYMRVVQAVADSRARNEWVPIKS